MASEYPRLFNERFPAVQPASSRPSSPGANDADADDYDNNDDDETAWLGDIVGNAAEAEGAWDRVEPINSGTLTIQFGR